MALRTPLPAPAYGNSWLLERLYYCMRRTAEEIAPALLLYYFASTLKIKIEFLTTSGVSKAGLFALVWRFPIPHWEPKSTRAGVWLGREQRKLAKCSTCELEEHRTVRSWWRTRNTLSYKTSVRTPHNTGVGGRQTLGPSILAESNVEQCW
jgi:hypothetical protein